MSSTDDSGTTDHVGRELDSGGEAQTVTQFAVQQGNLDGEDPAVAATVSAEQERAEQVTERAEQVSARLQPEQTTEQPPVLESTEE